MLFVNLFYFVKIFAFAQSLELHLIYIPCIAIIQAVISPWSQAFNTDFG